MKTSKALSIAVLALLFLLSSTVAFAQAPGKPEKGPSRLQKCLSIVGLSDGQKTQIRSIFEAARPELEALHQTLAADRQALKSAIEAVPQDACAIGGALVKVQASKKAVRAELEETRAAVVAVLTPDQKAKLEGCLEAPRDDAPSGSED